MSSTDAAALYWLETPTAALVALRDELGFKPSSSSFIPNVYVVVGLHAGLIALYLLMYILWLAKGGGMSSVPRAMSGSGLSRVVPYTACVAYSVVWISLLLSVYREETMHNIAFQFLVYIPLPVSGWIQVHLLLRAVPARRALVQLHPPRGPLSRLNRFTDSRITQNILLIALVVITIATELPFPILAGKTQSVVYREYNELAGQVTSAVEGGSWGAQKLTEVGPLLADIATKGKKLNDYCTWNFYVLFAWTCAVGAVYIPYVVMMILLIQKQVRHLETSLSHMADVNALRTTIDPPHATHSFEERETPLNSDVGYSGNQGKIRNPAHVKEVREKLGRVRRLRHVVMLNSMAMVAGLAGLLGTDIYLFTGPRSFGWISREVLVYLPSYTYLGVSLVYCIDPYA